ncbi:hypothetical protein FQZ97_939140 [compost metagenome]
MELDGQFGTGRGLEPGTVGRDCTAPVLGSGVNISLQQKAHRFLGSLLLHGFAHGKRICWLLRLYGQFRQAPLRDQQVGLNVQCFAQTLLSRRKVFHHGMHGRHSNMWKWGLRHQTSHLVEAAHGLVVLTIGSLRPPQYVQQFGGVRNRRHRRLRI